MIFTDDVTNSHLFGEEIKRTCGVGECVCVGDKKNIKASIIFCCLLKADKVLFRGPIPKSCWGVLFPFSKQFIVQSHSVCGPTDDTVVSVAPPAVSCTLHSNPWCSVHLNLSKVRYFVARPYCTHTHQLSARATHLPLARWMDSTEKCHPTIVHCQQVTSCYRVSLFQPFVPLGNWVAWCLYGVCEITLHFLLLSFRPPSSSRAWVMVQHTTRAPGKSLFIAFIHCLKDLRCSGRRVNFSFAAIFPVLRGGMSWRISFNPVFYLRFVAVFASCCPKWLRTHNLMAHCSEDRR